MSETTSERRGRKTAPYSVTREIDGEGTLTIVVTSPESAVLDIDTTATTTVEGLTELRQVVGEYASVVLPPSAEELRKREQYQRAIDSGVDETTAKLIVYGA